MNWWVMLIYVSSGKVIFCLSRDVFVYFVCIFYSHSDFSIPAYRSFISNNASVKVSYEKGLKVHTEGLCWVSQTADMDVHVTER